jgi:hypothetical protein
VTRTALAAAKDTDLIRLDISRPDAGEAVTYLHDDEEMLIVVLCGVVEAGMHNW